MLDIIFRSLSVNISATLIGSVLAITLGVGFSVYDFRGKRILGIVLNVMMGLPPVVVGLFLYLLLSRRGILGVFDLLYSIEAMIIAQVVLIAPLMCALTVRTMEDIWLRYRDLVKLVGGHPWICGVRLLLDYPRLVMMIVMAGFGRALAEVGAVMIVGGNIEGNTRMVTGSIILETSKGDVDKALQLGWILLGLSLLVNILVWMGTEWGKKRKEK